MAKGYMTGMAKIKCSAGTIPLPIVLPVSHGVVSKGQKLPLLNANDHIPMVNIMPFGLCKNKPAAPPGANVCIPVTPLAWKSGDTHCFVGGAPALSADSSLTCMMGGTIKFQ
ncbi:MAG: DUF4280 domain-containing protein [Selenomonadaceae bacterium]|nr:DUF4280 domain-containing protein [Selenomonadaceae bacterium]